MKLAELGLITVIAGAIGAAAAQDDPAAQERKRLEGAWKVVASQTSGVNIPVAAYARVTVTFESDSIEFKDGAKIFQEVTFKLDVKAKPRTIDLLHVAGLKKGSRELGIYELQGDQLTLCIAPRGRARPDEFASPEGTGVQVLKLKRVATKKSS